MTQASGSISGLHRVVIGLPIAIAISGLTVLVTLLSGAVPAWHAARTDFSPFLRATIGPPLRAWRVLKALVIAQIALSCVLLIGAGLLARTCLCSCVRITGFSRAVRSRQRLCCPTEFCSTAPGEKRSFGICSSAFVRCPACSTPGSGPTCHRGRHQSQSRSASYQTTETRRGS